MPERGPSGQTKSAPLLKRTRCGGGRRRRRRDGQVGVAYLQTTGPRFETRSEIQARAPPPPHQPGRYAAGR